MTIIDIVFLVIGLIFLVGPFYYIKKTNGPSIHVGSIVTPKRDVLFRNGEKHSVGDEIVVSVETIAYFKSNIDDYDIVG